MNYYTIPTRIMKNIKYAQEDILSINLTFQDNNLLKTLDVDKIHFNENNIIDEFIGIFQTVLDDFEEESFDKEDRDNLHEIIEALNNRKKAIQDITYDVLKRREECCCY